MLSLLIYCRPLPLSLGEAPCDDIFKAALLQLRRCAAGQFVGRCHCCRQQRAAGTSQAAALCAWPAAQLSRRSNH